MCQSESTDSPKVKEVVAEMGSAANASSSVASTTNSLPVAMPLLAPILPPVESLPVQTPPAKRGRGRPKRITSDRSPAAMIPPATSGSVEVDMQLLKGNGSRGLTSSTPDSAEPMGVSGPIQPSDSGAPTNTQATTPMTTSPPNSQYAAATTISVPIQARGQGQKIQSGGEGSRRRGKKQVMISPPIPGGSVGPDIKVGEQLEDKLASPSKSQAISQCEIVSSISAVNSPTTITSSASLNCGKDNLGVGSDLNPPLPLPLPCTATATLAQTSPTYPSIQMQSKRQNRKSQIGAGTPRRRGKKQETLSPVPDALGHQCLNQTSNLLISSGSISGDKTTELKSLQENNAQEPKCVFQDQALQSQGDQDLKSMEGSDDLAKQTMILSSCKDSTIKSPGEYIEHCSVKFLKC